MKKLLLAAIIFLVVCGSALAQTATSSGLQTSDGAMATRAGYLTGIMCTTDGANACTAIVYDNATTNSGTVLAKLYVPGASISGTVMFHIPVRYGNGIYVDVSGTNAAYLVYFIPSY